MPITPVEASREIVDALPPGVGRLEVIEGAGHFPWKDVPDRYIAVDRGLRGPGSRSSVRGSRAEDRHSLGWALTRDRGSPR